MAVNISVKDFVQRKDDFPLIDVRSPGEFQIGHIHGAMNIPIFSNEERAIVGTYYKKNGKYKAVLSGLDIVGPKLSEFARQAHKIAKEGTLYVHCWRGGMRSKSMAWLFETVGLKAIIIEGGYKSYRNYFRAQLSNLKLNIIGGPTGSAKTKVLYEIEKKGEQILDLEAIANHKGSAFGSIGQDKQCTNEQFENNLFYQLGNLNLKKLIWLEDESKSIGKNYIPDELFENLRSSRVFYLQIPKEKRAKYLVDDYGKCNRNLLEESIHKISKRLGGQHYKTCLDSLKDGNLYQTALISLNYYDKTYEHGLSKRNQDLILKIESETIDWNINANLIYVKSKEID